MPGGIGGVSEPYGVRLVRSRVCAPGWTGTTAASAADEVTAVYIPTAPQQLRVPRLPRAVLPVVAFGSSLALWAILSFSTAGNESGHSQSRTAVDPSAVHAVAFLEHSQLESALVLYDTAGGAPARTVVTFERINGGDVYGSVAPDAAHAAVVHPAPHGGAQLSIVDLSSGSTVTSPAIVDANTALAWSPASDSVVAVTSTPADATGRLSASLLQVDAATGGTVTLTTFPSALQVAPVGFVPGSGAVLTVVIDQSGSSLWSVQGDEQTPISPLSSGRTRDWVLSPDGAMLAFIEVRSGGDVPAIGRVVFTPNGAPAAQLDERAPFDGVAWQAGSTTASFGGPGGNIAIDASGDSYLVPAAWSPDGSTLVARVVEPTPGGETSAQSWQIVPASDNQGSGVVRTILFDHADNASFLGWARTSLLNPASSDGATTWP